LPLPNGLIIKKGINLKVRKDDKKSFMDGRATELYRHRGQCSKTSETAIC
jgi:hypothetical protein